MKMEIEYEELTRDDNSPLLEEIAADGDSNVTLDEALKIRKQKKIDDQKKRAEEKKRRKELGGKIRPDFMGLIGSCDNYKLIKGLYKQDLISKQDYKEFKSLSKKVLKGLDYQMGQYVEINNTYIHKKAEGITPFIALPGAVAGAAKLSYAAVIASVSVGEAISLGIFCGIVGCTMGATISLPLVVAAVPIARRIMYNNRKKHYENLEENLELLDQKISYIDNKMNLSVDLDKVINLSDKKANDIHNGINYVKKMKGISGRYNKIIKKYELK